jgi:Ca2+-binding EF-hand superfamily protein
MHLHPHISSVVRGMSLVALLALASTAHAQMAAEANTPQARAEAAFKRADLNGDGKLSKSEAESMPAVANKFDEIDKDKDGFLSLAEFMAGTAPSN